MDAVQLLMAIVAYCAIPLSSSELQNKKTHAQVVKCRVAIMRCYEHAFGKSDLAFIKCIADKENVNDIPRKN